MKRSGGYVWRYRIALGGVVVFAGIVALQHVVQPHLDPRTHEVSEYVNGSAGWLMVVGFLAWAASLAATAVVAAADHHVLRGPMLVRGRVLALAVAATGIFVTACFPTQTSAGRLPVGVRLALGGRLHDLASGVATVALVVAALASIGNRDGSRAYRRWTAAVLVLALVTDVGLLMVGPGVAGIRQRVLLLCGVAWQLMALREWDAQWQASAATSSRQMPS